MKEFISASSKIHRLGNGNDFASFSSNLLFILTFNKSLIAILFSYFFQEKTMISEIASSVSSVRRKLLCFGLSFC